MDFLGGEKTQSCILKLEFSISRTGFNSQLGVLELLVDEDPFDDHGREVIMPKLERVDFERVDLDRAFHGGKPEFAIAGPPTGRLETAVALSCPHALGNTIGVAND